MNKKGSISLETTLVIACIFPIVILFFLYGYFYFSAQNQNINLNFNTGRYVSVTGCSYDNLKTMKNNKAFNKYRILVNGKTVNDIEASVGQISITCGANAKKGDEFSVLTEIVPNTVLPYFNTPSREMWYVQETE